jgi:putative tryptophan/tyrosine transport system substrate-binding protein
MIDRRAFIAALGGTAAARPCNPHAQSRGKVVRVGYLGTASRGSSEYQEFFGAFVAAMRELGYVEGQNLEIEHRGVDGRMERFPALARELVSLKPDVIVAANTPAAQAVGQATPAIPIVVPVMGDPVGDGLVDSLARPGRNITGLTFIGPELAPKRLALLKEALPAVSRVAALFHPGAYSEHTMANMVKETEAAARTVGVELRLLAAAGPDELDRAFAALSAERTDALFVFPSPMLFVSRQRIIDFATSQRLASMAMGREFVEIGGLMSYGANISDLNRRAALYVDRIMKGTRPGDLPVEQPTKFELVINLKTAKMFGLTIPPTVLARADEVIE